MSKSAVRSPGGFRGLAQNLWITISLAGLLGVLTGCTSGQVSATGPGGGRGGKKGGGGEVPVTVATATEKTVPVEMQVIGNVEAYSTI